jgi:hypothetical protein
MTIQRIVEASVSQLRRIARPSRCRAGVEGSLRVCSVQHMQYVLYREQKMIWDRDVSGIAVAARRHTRGLLFCDSGIVASHQPLAQSQLVRAFVCACMKRSARGRGYDHLGRTDGRSGRGLERPRSEGTTDAMACLRACAAFSDEWVRA